MGFQDTLHFDAKAYADKKRTESTPTLIEKHHSKVREFITHAVAAGAGVAGAPITLGISLGGSAYSSRQAYIIHQQQVLIEAELTRRRVPIPRTRIRDVAAGGAIGAAGAAISLVLPFGVYEITGDLGGVVAGTALPNFFPGGHPDPTSAFAHNAPAYPSWGDVAYGVSNNPQAVACAFAHHAAPPSMGGPAPAPVPFHYPSAADAQGFAHGAAAALSSQAHHLAQMVGYQAPYVVPNAPHPPGFSMGVHAVGTAESFGGSAAANAALGAVGKRIVR
ncbi:hypothetical protein FRC14_005316 [Serendipita sp. 396]|nr:hypothetical protein FRC14_005316 [Serendipita sp. 396]